MGKQIVILILFSGISLSLYPQYSIKGFVRDAENGEVLPGANILIENTYLGAFTDKNGHFQFNNLKKGTYTLQVTFIGFEKQSIIIELNENMDKEIRLNRKTIMSEEFIVSATRADANAPASFSIIDKAQISEINLGKDFTFLINQTPSTVVTSDAGSGIGYTSIRIRGSDPTRINVTINGVPYNDAESQGTFWVDLPDFASSVDNIQIQRGVGSSTNGAGAFGASINILTTTLNTEPYFEFRSSAGSFNTFKNTVNFSTGLLKGKFAMDGRLSKIYSDGYIDRAFSDLKSYYMCSGYYTKSGIIKFITFSGLEKSYQAWYGVPEDSLESKRTFNPYNYENQTDNYQQDNYQLLLNYDLKKKWTAQFVLHYTKGKGYYEEYRENDELAHYKISDIIIGTDTIRQSNLIRRRWLNNDFYGATYSFINKGIKTQLRFGGAWNQYLGNHYGEVIWAKFAGNSEIDHRYYDNDALKNDFNLYLKSSRNISKKVHVTADIQYRNVFYSFYGFDNDGRNVQQAVNHHFINPKTGIYYQYNHKTSLYLSFAIANREPNRDDYVQSSPQSRPKPEHLRDIEAGYRYKGNKTSISMNYYYMNYHNQLVLTGQINDVGEYNRTNIAHSYRTGLEIEASRQLTKKAGISGNLTLSRNRIKKFTEYLDNYDDWSQIPFEHNETDIAFSPSAISTINATYKITGKLFLIWTAKYVGKQYLDNTSNPGRMINDYFTNDCSFSYKTSNKTFHIVELNLTIYNLFNNLYESNGWTYSYFSSGNLFTENYYFPQAGIHLLGGIRLKI